MHFNEMSTRTRALGLTFIVSALALAVFLMSRGHDWAFTPTLESSHPQVGLGNLFFAAGGLALLLGWLVWPRYAGAVAHWAVRPKKRKDGTYTVLPTAAVVGVLVGSPTVLVLSQFGCWIVTIAGAAIVPLATVAVYVCTGKRGQLTEAEISGVLSLHGTKTKDGWDCDKTTKRWSPKAETPWNDLRINCRLGYLVLDEHIRQARMFPRVKLLLLALFLAGTLFAPAVHDVEVPLQRDKLSIHVAVVLVLASGVALLLISLLDLGVYHRMLRGAVSFGEELEHTEIRPRLLTKAKLGMTEAISHFSRHSDARVDKNSKEYLGKDYRNAEEKVRLFYSRTFALLVVMACVMFTAANLRLGAQSDELSPVMDSKQQDDIDDSATNLEPLDGPRSDAQLFDARPSDAGMDSVLGAPRDVADASK